MTISLMDFFGNLINEPYLLIITILISGVMYVNGATDVPNAIATCVSTRCLTIKKALILAVVANFLGVLIMTLISSKVAETVFNIVNFGDDVHTDMIALSSALIGIVLWSIISWIFGIPTSQSHALLSGISGAAIALSGNFSGVNFEEWKKVLYGLFLVNLLAFILGLVITKLIEKICKNMDRRKTNKFFRKAQIVIATAMCFMNGAQDGQKFIAILLLGVSMSSGLTLDTNFAIPIWLIFYCSIIMATGTIIGGVKIIKTVGTKVVKVEKYQAVAADVASTMCLLRIIDFRYSC